MTIRAIYENGVFRPMEQLMFPEGKVVELEVIENVVDVRSLVPPGANDESVGVYEILSRRFNSGHNDTAERHNEHQP
jgi:predicted DNA-binding antitoxin AbrB/MazE fold protein